uniref:Uncharacterized protein n=1 Tax=Acrobeloides nanus TaxID=290746 RepID=A0A914BVX3_9BILA
MIPLKKIVEICLTLILANVLFYIIGQTQAKNISISEVVVTPSTIESSQYSTTASPKKSLFFSLLYPFPLPWEIIPRRDTYNNSHQQFNTTHDKNLPPSAFLDDIPNDIDDEYKQENSTLAMNDTEIVVVGNGKHAFRIIDEEHQMIKVNVTILDLKATISPPTTTINSTSETITTSTMNVNKTTYRPHRRLLPVTTPKCENLSEKQKYTKLESIGGRNQQFMANTPEEAGKNFVNLLPETELVIPVEIDSSMLSDSTINQKRIDQISCDERCEEIKIKLYEAVQDNAKKFFNRNNIDKPLNDSGPPEVQEGRPIRSRSGCYLEKFITVGNCTSRGEEEIWGYEKLCSACQGVYLMSDHCFPSFINAVTCDKAERQCIFDRFTSSAHGKCQSKTLSFKIMRNKGTKECEEWVYEYIDVPIACECFLSKSSWLNSMPEA